MKAKPSASIIEEKPRPTFAVHICRGSFLSQFVFISFSKLLKSPFIPPNPGQSSGKANDANTVMEIKDKVVSLIAILSRNLQIISNYSEKIFICPQKRALAHLQKIRVCLHSKHLDPTFLLLMIQQGIRCHMVMKKMRLFSPM